MDTELLFTLDLGGWARPHSHWTGLSFALTDRDNPLSSTTSFPSEALARLPESVLALNIISRSTVSTFTRTEAMLTPICFMKALNEEWKLCDISLWATVPFYSVLFWQHSIFFFFTSDICCHWDMFMSSQLFTMFFFSAVAQTGNYLFWRITSWAGAHRVRLMCRMCTKQKLKFYN